MLSPVINPLSCIALTATQSNIYLHTWKDSPAPNSASDRESFLLLRSPCCRWSLLSISTTLAVAAAFSSVCAIPTVAENCSRMGEYFPCHCSHASEGRSSDQSKGIFFWLFTLICICVIFRPSQPALLPIAPSGNGGTTVLSKEFPRLGNRNPSDDGGMNQISRSGSRVWTALA